jgi:hypothetical protein
MAGMATHVLAALIILLVRRGGRQQPNRKRPRSKRACAALWIAAIHRRFFALESGDESPQSKILSGCHIDS